MAASSTSPSVAPPIGALGAEFDAFDDASAAHLEDLHHRAGRSHLHAEDVAIAELGRRHLLLALVERLHRAHRVAQLRRLLESLALGRLRHARLQVFGELVVAALEKQPRHRRRRVRTRRANRSCRRTARCIA